MKKDVTILFRCSKEEKQHLKKQAAQSTSKFRNGEDNFSEYLRATLMKETNFKNKNVERQLNDLRYELRKIGTNINQVTKKINAGFGNSDDIQILNQQLDAVQALFKEYEEKVDELWQSPY